MPLPAKQRKNERLQRHRNLGKALYESVDGASRSVEEFRQALELAPESLPDRLNLGLALLRAERIDEGMQELQRVQKADPAIPHTWFNLGMAFRKRGRISEVVGQLTAAPVLDFVGTQANYVPIVRAFCQSATV